MVDDGDAPVAGQAPASNGLAPSSKPQRLNPHPDSIAAVLIALVMQIGEPMIEPRRVQYSIGRPQVEAGAGRHLVFEYVQDELNPFGRLDIIVVD